MKTDLNQTIAANLVHALAGGHLVSKPKYNYAALNESVKSDAVELILDDTLELVDEAEFNYRNSQLPDSDSCQHQVLAYVSGKTTFAQLCDIVGHHNEGYKYARDIAKQYFGMV